MSIEIACDNAAFEDNRNAELARILRKLADQIAEEPSTHPYDLERSLRDANGNKVGGLLVSGA